MIDQTGQPNTTDHMIVLKELSDIKTNLAVNTNETGNIKTSLSEIKISVAAIQADFVSRREFTDKMKAIEEEYSPTKRLVYGCVGLILIGFVAGILALIYK